MVMSELAGRRYYGKATHEWKRFKAAGKINSNAVRCYRAAR